MQLERMSSPDNDKCEVCVCASAGTNYMNSLVTSEAVSEYEVLKCLRCIFWTRETGPKKPLQLFFLLLSVLYGSKNP